MQISDNGLRLIEGFEGLSLSAYRDVVGVLTVGYGHTGKDVFDGQIITQDQSESLLRQDTASAAACVDKQTSDFPITQNQFDALTSFVYNVGCGGFSSSTLLKLLRLGDTIGAANQFLSWTKAGGKPVQGLINRRTAERKYFLGDAT